jgi:ribosomal protein L37AE/L43A
MSAEVVALEIEAADANPANATVATAARKTERAGEIIFTCMQCSSTHERPKYRSRLNGAQPFEKPMRRDQPIEYHGYYV